MHLSSQKHFLIAIKFLFLFSRRPFPCLLYELFSDCTVWKISLSSLNSLKLLCISVRNSCDTGDCARYFLSVHHKIEELLKIICRDTRGSVPKWKSSWSKCNRRHQALRKVETFGVSPLVLRSKPKAKIHQSETDSKNHIG